jgi:hypothetical protein
LQKSFVIFQKKKDGKADDAFVSANWESTKTEWFLFVEVKLKSDQEYLGSCF